MNYETNLDTLARSNAIRSKTTEPEFHVLVAYDHAANARRAILMVNGLAGRLRGDVEVRPDLLRFDIIPLLGTSETPAQGAETPDLVIVAADAERDLPLGVKHWLEEWANRRVPGGVALVALLEKHWFSATHSSPVRRFLQTLATRAGVEFFSREFSASPESLSALFERIELPWGSQSHRTQSQI